MLELERLIKSISNELEDSKYNEKMSSNETDNTIK